MSGSASDADPAPREEGSGSPFAGRGLFVLLAALVVLV